MKPIIILILSLSSLPLLAQRSITVVSPQICDMYLYNQDSTSLEKINSSFKARKLETLVVELRCKEDLAKVLDGTTLYLVVVNSMGEQVTSGGPIISIDGTQVQTYAKAVYQEGRDVSFEVNPDDDFRWKKGEGYMFQIYDDTQQLKRIQLLLN